MLSPQRSRRRQTDDSSRERWTARAHTREPQSLLSLFWRFAVLAVQSGACSAPASVRWRSRAPQTHTDDSSRERCAATPHTREPQSLLSLFWRFGVLAVQSGSAQTRLRCGLLGARRFPNAPRRPSDCPVFRVARGRTATPKAGTAAAWRVTIKTKISEDSLR